MNFFDRDPLARLLCSVEGDGGGDKGGAGGGAGGGGGGEPWFASKDYGFDQGTRDFFAGKNYPDVKTALASLPHADKMARDRNVLPMPDADPVKRGEWEGWEKLGWEKDLAKYTPKKPDVRQGVLFDEGLFDGFRKLAHEARIPLPAAEKLFNDGVWKSIMGKLDALDAKGAAGKADLDKALDQKYGADKAAKLDLAQRAMNALIKSPDKGKKINDLLGDFDMVETFVALGEKLGEDGLKGGGGSTSLSPEQARAERKRLEADKDWLAIFNDARHPQHRDYVARRQALIDLEAKQQRAA